MTTRQAVMLACMLGLSVALGCDTARKPKGPSDALEITDANFDETVKTGVTLVDFGAPWCSPCRTQGPIVEQVAKAYKGKAKIGKLNTDENSATPRRFGVRNIPTLILFKDGEQIEKFVGLQSEKALRAALDAQLQ